MNKPKLIIPRQVFDKVLHWCILAKGLEISGLGKCTYDSKTGTFTVVDAQVLQQSIQSAGNTQITAESIGKFMYETRDQGDIIWWWHSHHSMAAFWSGTDRQCIESFAKDGGVVATVFNNKGETLSACQFKTSSMIGESLEFHDQLDMRVVSYYDESVFKSWDEQYETARLKYTVNDSINRVVSGYDSRFRNKWQPSKKARKRWEKEVPEDRRANLIFEDSDLDWVWMPIAKRWREAVDNDYLTGQYFIDNANVQSRLGEVGAGQNDDILSKIYADKVRTMSGLSTSEWDLLTPHEKQYFEDQVDFNCLSDV